MTRKNQIDNFILKEAFKYLFEEEEVDLGTVEDSIENIKKNLEATKNDFDNKQKQLSSQKTTASGIQGSGEKVALQKKQASIGVEIAEKELEQSKVSIEALENKLKDLESQKQNIINQTKEKSQDAIQGTVSEALQVKPIPQAQQVKKVVSTPPVAAPQKKKDLIVRFDTNTANPFTVKFTNRGFLIGDTRLSFELLDKAISKNFSITLENGFVLTPIKMQKVLKYKDRI